MNILAFKTMKEKQQKISMVTCYDFWSAQIIADSAVDCILVGDSLATVMYGYQTTLPATVELIAVHTQAVARGAGNKFIIVDMPFLAHRKGFTVAMDVVEKLMQSGAQAVKIEGAEGHIDLVRHIVESGIPVMGHLGLTPQSIHQFGGHRVQGKEDLAAQKIFEHAQALEKAGCFALVLECIPPQLAKKITEKISIPTIGIGAGLNVDGQVLVLQDLLGFNKNFKPKFLKTFLDGANLIEKALNDFNQEVKSNIFPTEEHTY